MPIRSRMTMNGNSNAESGFGLIEVLITLLVFSVGTLAVAGLQAISKKNNFDALQRTSAAALADSIIANMRANPDALDQYLVPTGTPLGGGNDPNPPKNCFEESCTPDELAAFDLAQWESSLNGANELLLSGEIGVAPVQTGGLAQPSGCILGPAGGGPGLYTIIIAWRGVTELPDTALTRHACGAGRGMYGSNAQPNSESYQRFFRLQTYI